MIHKYIPATYNGCRNIVSVDHNQSCTRGGLVLARYDDAAKEWRDLRARVLTPSAI